MAMFKSAKIYIQVFRNKVSAINLETGNEVIVSAIEPFSSERQVLTNFNHVTSTLKTAINQLGVKKNFTGITMVMQQMEDSENGLSDFDKRGLRDIAEAAGAKTIYVITDNKDRPPQEILQIIKEWR